MVGRSDAYKEGFRSKYCDNPYQIGTQEYNDFERGWSQKVKRYPDSVSSKYHGDFAKNHQKYSEKSSSQELKESTSKGSYSAYAEAKGR